MDNEQRKCVITTWNRSERFDWRRTKSLSLLPHSYLHATEQPSGIDSNSQIKECHTEKGNNHIVWERHFSFFVFFSNTERARSGWNDVKANIFIAAKNKTKKNTISD